MKHLIVMTQAALLVALAASASLGVAIAPPSIYDIQFTADPDGISTYLGDTIDCLGGIVIHKYPGYKPKMTLYDPAAADGWGGLVIKDFTYTDAFADVNVGDWVSFTATEVEEAYGNTQLKFLAGSGFTVESTGNALPVPIEVTVFAEQYEAMPVKVTDVTITAMDLGSHDDNYNLNNAVGDFWAADYMNVDAEGLYHSYVGIGNTFQSVAGIIEATSTSDFQLLTRNTADFVVPEPASVTLLLTVAGYLRRRRMIS